MAVIDGKWLSKEGLTYFWSKIKSIFTKQTETNVIANLGAKNLLKITASSGTVNTATIDIADDGSMHITGQPTSNGAYVLSSGIELVIPGNAYILSMGAEAGNTKMSLSLRKKGTTQYVDLYHAESRIIPSGTYDRLHVYLYADTVYDIDVYPMIRPVEITDTTFQPYAPTNRELYETRFASKDILPNNVDLNNIKKGGIYNGVNSTGNSAVHMPVATGSFNFVLTVIEANEFIIQIFKQLNSAGDPNFYVRRFYIYNSDWDSWYQFTGTQV